MKKTVMLCLLALGSAEMAVADDLLGLYREALATDAKFAAAQAQYQATEQRVGQSRAALLPAITLSGNTASINRDSNTFNRQDYTSNSFSVNLTQPLFRWENKVAHDQSQVLVEQAAAERELARQDLVLRLAQAYFDVLLAQDALATIGAERAAIAEQLASARRGYDVGTANITDVRDAEARHDLVGAQQIVARNDLAAKREALRVIINREPGDLAPLRDGVALGSPEPDDMEAWVKAASTDGLVVVAGQAALEIARLETRKAQAGHYPKVDLTASYAESRSATINTVGTDLDEYSVGVQVSVPLYSGGAVAARQRETQHLLRKAEADLDSARRSGALTARQAFLATHAGLAQVTALGQALVSARTALASNQRGLELGVRANVDVLNAQQQVSTTERDLARSRYDTLMSLLRLKAAAGKLSDTDVTGLSALLN
jgi:outer membrane protein